MGRPMARASISSAPRFDTSPAAPTWDCDASAIKCTTGWDASGYKSPAIQSRASPTPPPLLSRAQSPGTQ